MKIHIVAATVVCLAMAGCGPRAPDKPVDISGGSACPDDGPRLPETGICQGRAVAYLDDNGAAREPTLPEGCVWSVNETMLPGDEALLYRAATCNGVTTRLAYAGGAHSASISYETSAVGGAQNKGVELIKLFGTDPDPQGALKAAIAALPAAERATCEIHPAGIEGWPSDALVIGPTPAARARIKQDGPLSACGPLGVDEDATTYWRIKQGFAWFFTLGQDDLDFDAASMTVIAKSSDGAWGAKP